ncbi:MerR family transcriptional regulator [Spiractinospora alimapuensis]|uniref:MerR family transcriptional regulator n=1 Tax=Spiractinospora alimapuensis TaxID=2820884 RepID=UPI001F3BE7EC|nr:MerR family transcriptional regulator [Spiractinospora alimapuensis]QVQ52814.1 MerR family transcriptional regulator [Spiractinospora alimapuensis]
MEWTIQELATRAGITTRTLRYYDRIGLLAPTRVGANGYRFYGAPAVARLQRVLVMRQMGMPLATIADVLAEEVDERDGLRAHISALEAQRDRINEQLRTVRHTLDCLLAGTEPGMDVLLEGFNDPYKDDVIARWGEDVYRVSNDWWHAKTLAEQVAWKRERDDLVADWVTVWRSGVSPTSDDAQEMAARHVEWLRGIPGTPTAEDDHERWAQMLRGLGDTYVDDPRFGATYHSREGAVFVRDALYAHTRPHP